MTSANKSLEKKNFLRHFLLWDFTIKNWLRLRREFKLHMESCEPADEEEMFSWNKIINALKRSRGNINPFTTFKPSGWKCYKTIGSYVSCAFIEIWSTLTYEPIINWKLAQWTFKIWAFHNITYLEDTYSDKFT